MRSRGEPEYVPRYSDTYFLHSRLLDGKLMGLAKTVQELRDELAESQRAANEEKDRLNGTIISLCTRDENSSASISVGAYVSLTLMSIRRQNHASRTDYPTTPRPTCRRSTQSRRSQPCNRAEASMRIPVCPRPRTGCCGMSSGVREYRKRWCDGQQVNGRLARW